MANYQLLKADIDKKVYQNGKQEITGENLNSVLNAMVTTLGAEYQFAGVATTATNPATPDAKVFYIANGKGTYTNFGGLEVTEDEVVVLYWDTAWHKEATGIASHEKLTELNQRVIDIAGLDVSNEQFKNGFWFGNEFELDGDFGLVRSTFAKMALVDSFTLNVQAQSLADLQLSIQIFSDSSELAPNYDLSNIVAESTTIENFKIRVLYNFPTAKYFTVAVSKVVSGQYQSFDATLSLISSGKIDENESVKQLAQRNERNIWGEILFSLNGYINRTTGEFTPLTGNMRATDYIRVAPGDILKYSLTCNGASIVAFYNAAKIFMPAISISDTTGVIHTDTITVPDGAAYVRFSNFLDINLTPVVEFSCDPLRFDVWDLQNRATEPLLQQFLWGDNSFVNDGYINKDTGEFTAYDGFKATNLIRVAPGDIVNYSLTANGGAIVALYDKDGVYKAQQSIIDTTGVIHTDSLTIPDGIAYVRACNYTSTNGDPKLNFATTALSSRASGGQAQVTGQYNIADSINKPIVFNGKSLVAFGDSITAGVSSPNLGNAGDDKYISKFCSLVGANLTTNYAVSGSCITDADGVTTSIYDRVLAYTGNADIIWIAGGTNDWNTGKEIGTYESADVKTLYGALRAICEHLKTNHPNAVVIFVTPIPYTTTNQYSSVAPLDAYRSAIYEIATLYGYNVVNGKDLGMPFKSGDWGNSMCADSDGCHPTIDGHKLYARNLTGKLL